MNGILVFDPSNDLVFAKSNKLFRKQILKYSRLNGLLISPSTSDDSTSTRTSPLEEETSAAAAAKAARATSGISGSRHGNFFSTTTTTQAPSSSSSFSHLEQQHNQSRSHFATRRQHKQANSSTARAHARPLVVEEQNELEQECEAPFIGQERGQQTRLAYQRHSRRRAQADSSWRCEQATLASSFSDTGKEFLDILMLLLTPYVASLRLSNSMSAYDQLQREQHNRTGSAHDQKSGAARKQATDEDEDKEKEQQQQQQQLQEEDLLSKFMSSININHECSSASSSKSFRRAPVDCRRSANHTTGSQSSSRRSVGQQQQQQQQAAEAEAEAAYLLSDEVSSKRSKQHSEDHFEARKFSSLPMPVDCLKECQIVYCQLYDFIFIYMQQLELNSSFKMRLLQKRVDLFARLALILFGPALNGLRYNSQNEIIERRQKLSNLSKYTFSDLANASKCGPQVATQSEILRQTYDLWLEHQFEPQFLLEANERLIVGSSIEQMCKLALERVSRRLRMEPSVPIKGGGAKMGSLRETHMHALLYSDTKLITRYSCRNSHLVQDEDQVLLLLLLKTFNQSNGFTCPKPDDGAACSSGDESNARMLARAHKAHHNPHLASGFACYPSNYKANKHTYEINQRFFKQQTPSQSRGDPQCSSMWNLSARGRRSSQASQTAHSQQFAASSSNLATPAANWQIPNQFLVFLSTGGKFSARLRVPHMLRFVPLSQGVTLVLISEISTSYLCLQLNRILNTLNEFNKFSYSSSSNSGTRINLKQLAKINDCVGAIKSYFYGENYDDDDDDHDDDEDHDYGEKVAQQRQQVDFNHPTSYSATDQSNLDAASAQSSSGGGGLLANFFGKYLSGNSSSSSSSRAKGRERGLGIPGTGSRRKEEQQQQQEVEEEEEGGTTSGRPRRRSVYESLSARGRRQCCQLVCRLEDLVSSNVHTYMRQTFSLSTDEHKRDALLNSVANVLRDSIETFVLRAQVTKLNSPRYLRKTEQLFDQVRVMAREQLNDYLEYLAIKSNCNVTLGAPLTHDMRALRAFIYVDRSRQELLLSPMQRDSDRDTPTSAESGLEASAFFARSLKNLTTTGQSSSTGLPPIYDSQSAHLNHVSSSSSSSSASCSFSSSSSTSGDESSSDSGVNPTRGHAHIHHSSSPTPSTHLKSRGARVAPPGEWQTQQPTCMSNPQMRSSLSSQWLVGASSGMMTATEESTNSSALSILTTNSSSRPSASGRGCGCGGGHNNSDHKLRAHHSEQFSVGSSSSKSFTKQTTRGQHQQLDEKLFLDELVDCARTTNGGLQPSANLVDENLIKGFTCFIYNRLANGRGSFSSTDDERRRWQLQRELEQNFISLPSIVCDDFFNTYSRSLFGNNQPKHEGHHSKQVGHKDKQHTYKRSICCDISHLEETTTRAGLRLLRRRLTQLKEEDEEENPEEELRSHAQVVSTRASPKDSQEEADDFVMFLRGQAGSCRHHQHNHRRYHRNGTRIRRSEAKIRIYRTAEERETKGGVKSGAGAGKKTAPAPKEREGVKCYELFCVHQSSLLVHRSQVLVEAQRLAHRLARLQATCLE